MQEGRAYPHLDRIQQVSLKIACDVAKYALSKNMCHLYPIPDSIENFIEAKVYKTTYDESLKSTWNWPSAIHHG
jgi:hypothetical protein